MIMGAALERGDASALYEGSVTHTRLRPKRHRLRYRTFALLLDLDHLDALDARLAFFSHNRFNLFSIHDRDHGAGGPDLRAYVDATLGEAGIDLRGGQVLLLSMPRILGYVFNPISIYYCHRADGSLAAVLHEVTNTFGQRHSYLADAQVDANGVIRQSCTKELYVSPFIGMDMTYDFRLSLPGERLTVAITGSDEQGILISASQAGKRRALSDGALVSAFLRHPLLTLKVVGGIHFEALKLWLKGVKLVPRPAPPAHAVTHIPSAPAHKELTP